MSVGSDVAPLPGDHIGHVGRVGGRDLLLVAAVHLIAWGGLLLSADAIYWDDWIVFDATLQETWDTASEIGLLWSFLLGVLSRGGPAFVSLLAFLGFLAASLSMLIILSRIPILSRAERTFGAAVFAAAPLMAARNSAVLVVYILSLAAVLALWVLVTRDAPTSGRTVMAALPLILVASLVPSAGLFLAAPVAHLLFLRRHELRNPSLVALVALAAILPVAQLVGSRLLLPARGIYEGYNEISPRLLVAVAIALGLSALVAGLMTARLWRRRTEPVFGLAIGAVGGVLLALGLAPYVAVGHLPPYDEWSTRHELLLPVGVAVAAAGIARLLRLLPSRHLARVIMVAVIVVLMARSAAISLDYRRDWEKQEALIELIRHDAYIRLADVVHFTDDTRTQNVFDRSYRFYEWNGLMVRAFGDSRRFTVSSLESIPGLLEGQESDISGPTGLYYGARDFDPARARMLARVTASIDEGAPSGVTLSSTLEPLDRHQDR